MEDPMLHPLSQAMMDTAFVATDVDARLAFYLFRPPFHHRNGLAYLNHLMLTFGRSRYDGFLRTCRNIYYRHLFGLFEVSTFDALLQKMFKRSMRAVRYFQAHQGFVRDAQRTFNVLNGRQRHMLRHLCAYHGYAYVHVGSTWCGSRKNGLCCAYFDFWDDRRHDRSIPVPYSELYRSRVHDLKHYVLVERKSTLWESTFLPKPSPDHPPYKKWDTVEKKDIECIKIL